MKRTGPGTSRSSRRCSILQSGGRGQIVTWPGGGTEKLIINHTDPQTEQDGQYSSYKVPHPHFQELEFARRWRMPSSATPWRPSCTGRAAKQPPTR